MSEPTTDHRPPLTLGLLLAELAAMIRFWSRLPCPRLGPHDDPAAPPPFGRAIRALPLAGAVIALPAAVVAAVLSFTQLSAPAIAALAVTVATLTTWAFHEDGFADVADGFGGGASRERRLEIMKDSRIGAFGGAALAAQFLLRTVLLADLIDGFDASAAWLLLGVAGVARVGAVGLMAALPPARADGLARAAGAPERGALAIALCGAVALFAIAAVPVVGVGSALAGLIAGGVALAGLARAATAKIGGHTGDVVGAGVILTEIAVLTGLAAV